MDAPKHLFLNFVLFFILAVSIHAAPFRYVWAKAYHILPQTTSEESGYFSLCEGLNKRIYVGTAKYQQNAYLVEFNPHTELQRIVIDVNQVCGLTATGYAAQAKIHTRNFVGPSGTIYVGSKQGYPVSGDTSVYPGGYLMTYDPASDTATNLGMPYPTQGIIDTVADEARQLIYIVTCENQHWMLFNRQTTQFTELSVTGTPYATTLIDARGIANLLSTNFNLAQYNPDTSNMLVRPIYADGQLFSRTNSSAIPTWNLRPDRTKAYLILMNDPRLLEIDLLSTGSVVTAHYLGKMVEGTQPDSRCALSVAPDGKVFAVVKVRNTTGFVSTAKIEHWLHRLVFYDPRDGTIHDLGALAVQNSDWYTFTSGSPNTEGWPTSGFEQLPDNVIVPRYHHMAMMVASDYSIYVTIIYPFTLLHVPAATLWAYKTPEWWMASYGLTNKDFGLAVMDDDDHDGLDNWKEYRVGTDPTNGTSAFKIIEQGSSGGSNYIAWTGGGVTDLPPFSIWRCTNQWQTSWDFAGSFSRPPTLSTNIWYDPLRPPSAFYRIEAPPP